VKAANNWNLNDSHIKKAIKCQYLNLMLSILSMSLHYNYTLDGKELGEQI